MDWIQKIRECFDSNSVFYTRHAKLEMEAEEFGRIFDREVFEAICNGEVIEEYPGDTPYPSALIFGRTTTSRPLHILCAYNKEENLLIIITVYQPDPGLWIEYKRRK
ncbi:MAG: DUF4258 domain-containing protein [Deltaproteobacteria bacterium]|nr:DUF4258 domain-containing protein [Deltaproteobacteria bacterium]